MKRQPAPLAALIALLVISSALMSHVNAAPDSEPPAISNTVGMKLRLIPAGYFLMGDEAYSSGYEKLFNAMAHYNTDDERPRHPVRLTQPFYLGETEVTVGQFKQFVEATGYRTTAEENGQGIDGFQPIPPENEKHRLPAFEQRPEFTWRHPGFAQSDDHPVVGVSYDDAQAYCKWLSAKEQVTYRLPTEAEWEYACGAGRQTWYAWGDNFVGIDKLANIGNVELEKAYPQRVLRQWLINVDRDPGDGHVFTAPVGSYPANAWGLRDMHGNVWEWCEDHYGDTFYKKFARERYNVPEKLAIDPINTTPWNDSGSWRVIRGGCWYNVPTQCRTQTRGYFDATDAGCYLGFRVAREGPADAIAASKRVFDREQEATRLIIEASGPLRAGENDRREGIRVILTPEMKIGEHLRYVPGLIDVLIDRSNTPVSAQLIADVCAVEGLRSLVMYQIGNELTDADLAPLAAKTTLERLNLQGESKLTDAMLAHLAGLTELRDLRLDISSLTDAGLMRLSRLKKLEILHLSGTASKGEALAAFDGAPLRSLVIWGLTDEHTANLDRFPDLTELRLNGSPITAAAFSHVQNLPHLRELDLTRCKNLDDTAFSPLAKLRDLAQLNAEGTGAGDEACRHLSRLMRLTDLHIGSPALTDAGLEHLGHIVSMRQLRITEAAAITDRGLRHLWRLDQLSYLALESPGVTGAGLRELADLKSLRMLMLSGAGVTDEGLKQVPMLTHVEQLRIGNNRGGPAAVTDAGLLQLADAPNLRQLEIYRRGMKITDEGIEQLRRAAPNLTIQLR